MSLVLVFDSAQQRNEDFSLQACPNSDKDYSLLTQFLEAILILFKK